MYLGRSLGIRKERLKESDLVEFQDAKVRGKGDGLVLVAGSFLALHDGGHGEFMVFMRQNQIYLGMSG